ncbi:hypothetical protein NC99_17280 [Sunxiuqinia dokdonensis]|uniref:Uncharacterized protein n=1 Tax=Sunxiuqinia dokdonensis TaxID=1409788 RepID=A0A0L8VAG1_9BACT|nr:hypothetical protein NC99_17280 [Sunxiuqinia dokdonensis]
MPVSKQNKSEMRKKSVQSNNITTQLTFKNTNLRYNRPIAARGTVQLNFIHYSSARLKNC